MGTIECIARQQCCAIPPDDQVLAHKALKGQLEGGVYDDRVDINPQEPLAVVLLRNSRHKASSGKTLQCTFTRGRLYSKDQLER